MDVTSPVPVSIVGSTNAAPVASVVAFAFGLVTRLPFPRKTALRGWPRLDGSDGGDHTSTVSGSPPR